MFGNWKHRFQKVENDLLALIKVQCQDGNWNSDPYMHGLANGLILALATLQNKEPEFKNAPAKFGCLTPVPTKEEFIKAMGEVKSEFP